MKEFTEDYYENQVFSNLSLEHAVLENTEFYQCAFSYCKFLEITFSVCKFVDCTFNNCDLSMVRMDGSAFSNTQFVKSRVIAIDWTRTSAGRSSALQVHNALGFEGCVLNYSSFVGLSMIKINIVDCIAREVDFSEANLKQANFSKTDLAKSVFRNTNLSEANFVGAKDYYIIPAQNTLTKAKFSLPEALSLLYNLDIVIEEGLQIQ
jgi:fluoroquinolone resistance protein